MDYDKILKLEEIVKDLLDGKDGLSKGEKGDWKTEGYELKHHPIQDHGKYRKLHIKAHSPEGDVVGNYIFTHDKNDEHAKPLQSNTFSDHQRKGLATSAYKKAQKILGVKLKPEESVGSQTPDAKKLWSQPNRPFGKGEELIKGEKGDWRKEGYKFTHETSVDDITPDWKNHKIKAHTKDGKLAGEYNFSEKISDKKFNIPDFHPSYTKTHPKHKRKGLATEAYKIAQDKAGKKLKPGWSQTAQAKKLWSQPNRPFGKGEGISSPLKNAVLGLKKAAPYEIDNPNFDIGSYPSIKRKIHEEVLPNGLIHRVKVDPDDDTDITHSIHHPENRKQLALMHLKGHPEEENAHPRVSHVGVNPKHKGKGLGKQLYLAAIDYHGGLRSDTSISPHAQKVWEHLDAHPNLNTELSEYNEYEDYSFHITEKSGKLKNKKNFPNIKFEDSLKPQNNLKKTLTAGSGNAAPSTLTGGAALQVEELSGEKEKKAGKSRLYRMSDLKKDTQSNTVKPYKTGDRVKHPDHGVGTVRVNHGDGHLTVGFDNSKDTSLSYKGLKVHSKEFGKSEFDESWFFLDDDELTKSAPPEEENIPHPTQPWVSKRHPNGRMMWHGSEGQSKRIDQDISDKSKHQKIMSSLPETHHQAYANMVKQTVKDPNRHFIPTEEQGKQKLRARHLKSLLSGNPSVKLDASHPDRLTLHRKSHSQGDNIGKTISIHFPTRSEK